MKKRISILLATLIFVSAAGCGNNASTETTGKTDQQTTEKQETTDQKTKENQETTESASDNNTSKEEEKNEPAAPAADLAMLEQANTNIQTNSFQVSFDDKYIYFPARDAVYRCNYDGSDVTVLSSQKQLQNTVVKDEKMWGYWWTGNAEDPTGLYSVDLATGSITSEVETSGKEDRITSVLISGNWMFYVAKNGMELVSRNLSTGEEKTICNWTKDENVTEDISMCIYGDTLYVLFYSSPSDYRYSLCSYDLGSNADSLTEIATFTNNDSPRAWIWMDDGLLIPASSQLYYAKWSDVKDGKWDYRKDENKVGTEFDDSISEKLSDNFNRSRYVLGNDLLVIDYSKIYYYKDFDFSSEQILLELDGGSFGINSNPHGIHDGAVYIYNYAYPEYEIIKITEGGAVERIPVTLPE